MAAPEKKSKLLYCLALVGLFFGCLGASVAGAGELFISSYETYGILGLMPALIISVVLGMLTMIASLFLFANSIRQIFKLPSAELSTSKKNIIQTSFKIFFSPINALVETACAYGALKEAGAPILVCYLFALLTLPLQYFFTQNETEEVIGSNSVHSGGRILYVAGVCASLGFSLAMAFVTFVLVSAIIPVPGLNVAIASILASGYAIAALASMVKTVRDLCANDGTSKKSGFWNGITAFYKNKQSIISSLAATCFATGSGAEVYMSLQSIFSKVPVLRSMIIVRIVIASICAASFAAINWLLAKCSLTHGQEHEAKTSVDERADNESTTPSIIAAQQRPQAADVNTPRVERVATDDAVLIGRAASTGRPCTHFYRTRSHSLPVRLSPSPLQAASIKARRNLTRTTLVV